MLSRNPRSAVVHQQAVFRDDEVLPHRASQPSRVPSQVVRVARLLTSHWRLPASTRQASLAPPPESRSNRDIRGHSTRHAIREVARSIPYISALSRPASAMYEAGYRVNRAGPLIA